MHVASVLLLALVLAGYPPRQQQAPQPQVVQPPVVQQQVVLPGYAGVGRLAKGEQVRLSLAIDAPGAVTLSLESLSFDPVVSVADGQGRSIGRDEDSGTGDGAWLALDVKPFVTYEIVVESQDGGDGPFHLEVRDGRTDPPPESDAQGLVRVYGLFAEHERGLGNLATTALLYYQVGELMCAPEFAEYPLAEPPLRKARTLAQELGNPKIVVAASAYLGACERRVGDVDEGIALLESAWEQRGVLRSPAFECLILENLGEALLSRNEPDAALVRFDAWAESAAGAGLVTFQAMAELARGRLLWEQGERAAADAAYDRALGLLDAVEEPYYRSQILLAVGRSRYDADSYEEAAGLLERASPCRCRAADRGRPAGSTWHPAAPCSRGAASAT
jgi:hypothetical protein